MQIFSSFIQLMLLNRSISAKPIEFLIFAGQFLAIKPDVKPKTKIFSSVGLVDFGLGQMPSAVF